MLNHLQPWNVQLQQNHYNRLHGLMWVSMRLFQRGIKNIKVSPLFWICIMYGIVPNQAMEEMLYSWMSHRKTRYSLPEIRCQNWRSDDQKDSCRTQETWKRKTQRQSLISKPSSSNRQFRCCLYFKLYLPVLFCFNKDEF